MKIIEKATMPNGINIQLEDWSEDYSIFPYGSTMGAYPKKYGAVRCQCDFNNNAEAIQAFKKLSSGEATIFDFNFTVMRSSRRVPIKECLDLQKFATIYGKI